MGRSKTDCGCAILTALRAVKRAARAQERTGWRLLLMNSETTPASPRVLTTNHTEKEEQAPRITALHELGYLFPPYDFTN